MVILTGMVMPAHLDLEGLVKHNNQPIKKNSALEWFTIYFLFQLTRDLE